MHRFFLPELIKLLTFLSLIFYSHTIFAQQYTLTDDDVIVVDGKIKSCSYSFEIKDIIIPETLDNQIVTAIDFSGWDDGVFKNKGIENVLLPSTIKEIGARAFESNSITSITIPDGVIKIAHFAFSSNKLSSVTLPKSLLELGGYAFFDNNLKNINIPNGITEILQGTFKANNLTSVNIPSTVKFIEFDSFSENSELDKIILPESVIEEAKFYKWADANGNDYNIGDSAFDFTISYYAIIEYVVKDEDTGIDNGLITSFYNRKPQKLIIPEKLNGQVVTGIANKPSWGVFGDKKLYYLELPNTLKAIGSYAFCNNKIIATNFPEGLTKIDEHAFVSNKLKSIAIPNSVEYIGINAFAWNKLTNVVLPNKIKTIEAETFYSNELINIHIPNSVTLIGGSAFRYNKLINVKFSENIKLIGNGSFADNNIKSLELPNTVTNIGQGAFKNNYIESIIIPDSITRINDMLFYNNKLTSIVLPVGIQTIGKMAFSNNLLTSVEIPNTVYKIDEQAFDNNPNLTGIILPNVVFEGQKFCYWIDGNGKTYKPGDNFTSFSSNLLGVFEHTLTDEDVVVIDGVIKSCSYNFFSKKIIIPEILDNQTIIGIDDDNHNKGVFSEQDIIEIKLPNTLLSIGENEFSSNKITNLLLPEGLTNIGANAFSNNQITNILIPSSISTLEDHVFSDNKLTSIKIPNGVKIIKNWVFNCNQLTSVDLPQSLNIIETHAFSNNPSLMLIVLPVAINGDQNFCFWVDEKFNTYEGGESINPRFKALTAIFDYTLKDEDVVVKNGFIESVNKSINMTSLVIPKQLDNQTIIGISEGDYYSGVFSNRNIIKLKLPETIKTIGMYAFGKNLIKKITFPNSTKKINNYSFTENYIENLIIPNSVELIGSNAFSDNKLINVKISSSVYKIEYGAFYKNHNLNAIALPSSLKEGYRFLNWIDMNDNIIHAGENITDFSNSYYAIFEYTLTDNDVAINNGIITQCYNDFFAKSIIIPEFLKGQEVIGINIPPSDSNSFMHKELTNVKLPNTLKEIGNYTFFNNRLSTINIPNKVTHIGNNAFDQNNRLKEIELPTVNIENDIFLHWINGLGEAINGGERISDFWTSYEAIFKSKILSSTYDVMKRIKIYPNPVYNSIKIDLPEGESTLSVNICNMQGNIYYQSLNPLNKTIDINTDNYPKGGYLVKINFSNGTSISRKLIKL